MTSKKNVLFVDDDICITEFITDFYSDENFNTMTSNSVEEAIEVIQNHEISFIVTDLVMPFQQGYDLIQELHDTNSSIPIVTFTGQIPAEDKIIYKHYKGNFSKPVNFLKVLEIIYENIQPADSNSVDKKEAQKEGLIVICDDDKVFNKIIGAQIKKVIGEKKLSTHFYENGLECLEGLSTLSKTPDLIILDHHMPKMTGLELLEKLRKSPKYSKVPIIINTNSKSLEVQKKARELRCDGYHIKPNNEASLFHFVNSWVESWIDLAP